MNQNLVETQPNIPSPTSSAPVLMRVSGLSKQYQVGLQTTQAISNASFTLYRGETLGLVGESGCGKSTVGKCVLRLIEPSSGTIEWEGRDLLSFTRSELRAFRKRASMIFQDPYASLNPRMTARDTIGEPLDIHRLAQGIDRDQQIEEIATLVGLSPELLNRFPHEFSGGQRQRIGIARSLIAHPDLLVCDEPISALDVSVQAQVINLLRTIQQKMGLTLLFIAHDLRVVKYLSTRVAVMYLGNLVEIATSDELYYRPLHPYTEALLSAIPIPDPTIERTRQRIVLQGEVPSPLNPPKGCPFANRCPKAYSRCHQEKPALIQLSDTRHVACHLIEGP